MEQTQMAPQMETPPQPDNRVPVEFRPMSPVYFVEERVFDSEIKRINSDIARIEKSIDKQEDKFTRAFEKLEATLNARFKEMNENSNARFEKIDERFKEMEESFNARFEKMDAKLDSNFKWLVGMYIPLTGVLLAAFYAFATYIR